MHGAAEEINNRGFSASKRNLDSGGPADNYVAFISLRYSRELISRRKRGGKIRGHYFRDGYSMAFNYRVDIAL